MSAGPRCQTGFVFTWAPPCYLTPSVPSGHRQPQQWHLDPWNCRVHGVQLLPQCCQSHHHQFSYPNFHLPLPTHRGGHQVPLIRDYTSSIVLVPAAGYLCLNPNLTTVLPHHQPIFRPGLIAPTLFSLLSHTCSPSLLYVIYNLNMQSLFCNSVNE